MTRSVAREVQCRARPRIVAITLGAYLLSFPTTKPVGLVAAENVSAAPARGLLPAAVNVTGLTIEKQDTLLGILSREPCSCGCVMVMARCLAVMPCHLRLSNTLADRLRSGYSRDQARLAMLESARDLPPPAVLPTTTDFAERPVLENTVVPFLVEGEPTRGSSNAPITIVEFSDFECSYCAEAARWADSVLEAYPHYVRIIFKQAPLASTAAHEQGRFWDMHDTMFRNNGVLSRRDLLLRAAEIGLNIPAFVEALDEHRYRNRVEQLIKEGDKAGIEGTPTFF